MQPVLLLFQGVYTAPPQRFACRAKVGTTNLEAVACHATVLLDVLIVRELHTAIFAVILTTLIQQIIFATCATPQLLAALLALHQEPVKPALEITPLVEEYAQCYRRSPHSPTMNYG